MAKYPKILATRDVPGRRLLRAEEVDLEFRNGEKRTYRRLVNNGDGAVLIVAVPDEETVLLVNEYGVGLDHYELGLPKGRLEPGESPTEGANRELKEEVGYGARELLVLGTLSLAPAFMTHVAHVVLARDLYPEKLEGDEPEPLTVQHWPLADLHELLQRDDVTDGRAIAALFMAREYLAGRYQP